MRQEAVVQRKIQGKDQICRGHQPSSLLTSEAGSLTKAMMTGAPAQHSSPQWFAYTVLVQFGYSEPHWFSEEGFATRQEAQAFLDGPAHDWPESPSRSRNYWRGPINLEALSGHRDYFTGPWLAEALKDADFDSEWTRDQRFNDDFAACAADVAPRVMGIMEANGEIPSDESLTTEHHQLVQRRLKKYELPEIECRLSADWDFDETEMNARLLAGQRTPNRAAGYERCLFAAALEIESLVRHQHHGRLSMSDICHLWTSFDLWIHLARFCREGLGRWGTIWPAQNAGLCTRNQARGRSRHTWRAGIRTARQSRRCV